MYCNVVNIDACLFDNAFGDFEFVMCIVAQTLALITMRGATDHLFSQMVSINGWYLFVL
jgi:hypothetical protein